MKVVIIGNGIAGITTAIELRKRTDCEIVVVSEETEYFFSRTALMYVFMGQMKFEHTQPYENSYWKKHNIILKKAKVISIKSGQNTLNLENSEKLDYDFLVIASGSKPNKFNWPGQFLNGVSGFYHKSDLKYLESYTSKIKHAVVVGGGLIGVELVEMLKSRGKEVTFLIRENSFWNLIMSEKEGRMLEKHIRSHGINLKLNTELKEIKGSIEVEGLVTQNEEVIDCQYVGLTVGVSPNIDFLKESGISTKLGILVDEYLQTNIENIFAIGDCAEIQHPQIGRRPIEAVWYTGKMMGEALAKSLSGVKTRYTPGFWFNSAKFFDIEFQTYGNVPAKINESQTECYWEKETKAVRIVFEKASRQFLGINTFGIRMRHQFFEKVLSQNQSVDFVLKNLEKANFDPEFYKKYEKEIRNEFLKSI
jgi:NAD(P)H-nitrite reductase large subunit